MREANVSALEEPTGEISPGALAFEPPIELSPAPPSMADFVDKQHPLLRIRPTSAGSLDVTLRLPPAAAFSGRPVYRWDDDETLELIRWEVAHLRSAPLNGMLSIDDPVVPKMAVDQRGDAKVIANGVGPPWAVYARLSGAKGGPYYVPGGVRVRLLLDGAYPAAPPEVHFMQTLHHFFLDNDNGLPQIFYELLSDTGDAERHSLRSTLLLCRILLQAPLHPCEGCNANFAAFSRMHDERLQTIEAYASAHKVHAGFFEGEWRREWLAPELREALAAADGPSGDGSDGDGGAALGGVLQVVMPLPGSPYLLSSLLSSPLSSHSSPLTSPPVSSAAGAQRGRVCLPDADAGGVPDARRGGRQLQRERAADVAPQLDEQVRARPQRDRHGRMVKVAVLARPYRASTGSSGCI